jgi:hypothetical protein
MCNSHARSRLHSRPAALVRPRWPSLETRQARHGCVCLEVLHCIALRNVTSHAPPSGPHLPRQLEEVLAEATGFDTLRLAVRETGNHTEM